MSLSAFCGEYVAVLECDLVRGRQDGLVKEDILYADIESVAAANVFGLSILVTVEEDLCANVLEGELELAAGGEDGIERVDVRVDGDGEGRIGCLVAGRSLKKLLAALRVEAGRPLGLWFAHGWCVVDKNQSFAFAV